VRIQDFAAARATPTTALPTLFQVPVSKGTDSVPFLCGLPVTDSLSLLKGTLDVLVLKALSWMPMHGFEITRWVEGRSDGALDVRDSALYQALHRLEERGFVSADWGITENNQRARYYRLTRAGRTHLAAETATWVKYTTTMTAILTAPPGPA
jgi:PadR family transcriptional regulator, regulatory protein PadR